MTSKELQQGETSMQFTAAERSAYRRPNTARLIFDLSLPWLQAIIGCTIFIAHPAVWTWLIAVVIIAGAQHGLALITHEAAHRLICPHNKRLNDLLAVYLFAAPAILPFNVYRQRHLLHHRMVSLQGDTKTLYLRDMRGWRFAIEVGRSLSGADFILQALAAVRAGKGEEFEDFSANLRRDQISLLLVHGALFLVFTAFDPLTYGIPTYYFILWLWPMLTVSFLFGKLRSLVEHQPPRTGLREEPASHYFMKTPAPLLRSVKATLVERLFLSKINFHFHAEHHLWPWISYQYLPEVNEKIWQGQNNTFRLINGNLVVCNDSYYSVLRNVMRGR